MPRPPFRPWEVRQIGESPKKLKIFEGDQPSSSGCIAEVPVRDGRERLAKHHARLIAAAPVLLSALMAVMDEVAGAPDTTPYSADSYLPENLLKQIQRAILLTGVES